METFKIRVNNLVDDIVSIDIMSKFVKGKFNVSNSYISNEDLVCYDNNAKNIYYLFTKTRELGIKTISYTDIKIDSIESNIYYEASASIRPKPVANGRLITFIAKSGINVYVYYITINIGSIVVNRTILENILDVKYAHIYKCNSESFGDIRYNINDKTLYFERNLRNSANKDMKLTETRNLEKSYSNKILYSTGMTVIPGTLVSKKIVTFTDTYYIYVFKNNKGSYSMVAEMYGKIFPLPDNYIIPLRIFKRNKSISEIEMELIFRKTGFIFGNEKFYQDLTKTLKENYK